MFDVLGTDLDYSDIDVPPDTGVYPNMSASGVVREALAQQYVNEAEIVTEALGTAELEKLVPCGKLEASCRDGFVTRSIERALRRPATPELVDEYTAVFDAAAEVGGPDLAFRTVLKSLLRSPYFLYRTEIGHDADAAKVNFNLTDHEVASLLSFSLTGAPPSGSLAAAAARGDLTDREVLGAEIRKLLASQAAAERLREFLSQWLRLHRYQDEVSKDGDVFPGFPDVKIAMLQEALSFVGDHGGPRGTLTELLTAQIPDPGGGLGAFYVSDTSNPGTNERSGILSLGAVLAMAAKPYLSSPTLRGLFVRDQLLCQHITLPDNFTPPPLEDSESAFEPTTTRELYELHAKDSACATCHTLLDPIGFVFEGFDGAGRNRTKELYRSPSFPNASGEAMAIDTRGTLVGTDIDGEYDSPEALSGALARSDLVKECFALQAFRFYFGEIEPERTVTPVVTGAEAFRGSDELGELLLALFSTPTTYRRVR